MPNKSTFNCAPIGDFVQKYITHFEPIVDPFCGQNPFSLKFSNDLNPEAPTEFHLDAVEFLQSMQKAGHTFQLGIFDPPWTVRQWVECYKGVGLKVGMQDTQIPRTNKIVRNALDPLIKPGGVVLSFGYHSNGMGKTRGYELLEILLVAHGGVHYDSICIAEMKKPKDPEEYILAKKRLENTVLCEKTFSLE